MRLATVLLFGVTTALATWGIVNALRRAEERREARIEGRLDADRDIERGTPWLRRRTNSFGRLPRDGIAVDRDTGLPLTSTAQWCGTCARLWGHIEEARHEAYNARILEAVAAGRLDGFRLDRKLRDKATLRALFATGQPAVLKGDGATALVGQVRVSLCSAEDLAVVDLAPADAAPLGIHLRYPHEYADAPKGLSMQYPPAPFEVLLADDDTTLILRDGESYAWVVDLPRALILEVVGPIS